jgi:hypothetical protein
MRRALRVVMIGGGLLAGCGRAPPQRDLPVEAVERVAVPAGAPAADAAPAAVTRAGNPPLRPEEGRLDVLSPPAAPPGTQTAAYLRVTAGRGYEINERYHYKLTLEPTLGVTLAKAVWSAGAHDADHLDEHELAITMKLTAARRGDYVVHGQLEFAVCKIDSQCLPKSMPVAVLVAAR